MWTVGKRAREWPYPVPTLSKVRKEIQIIKSEINETNKTYKEGDQTQNLVRKNWHVRLLGRLIKKEIEKLEINKIRN